MSVVVKDVKNVKVCVPDFEEIDKRWFIYNIPQYKYVLSCLEYGKAKTHEVLIFTHKGIKFYCLFDYFFGFDPVKKLKTYDVQNIHTTLFDQNDNILFYVLSSQQQNEIECIVLEYVNRYFRI